MSKRAAIVLAVLLVLIGASLAITRWLLFTEGGLAFLLARIERLPSVSIVTRGVRGTLADSLVADEIVIDHEALHVVARDVRVDMALLRLMSQVAAVDAATIGSLDVTLKSRPPQPDEPPRFLPRFLTVEVARLEVGPVALTLATGQRYGVARVSARDFELTRYRMLLPQFNVDDEAGAVSGDLTLRATQPLGLRGRLEGRWRLPDDRNYEFSAAVTGNLDRLGVDAALTQPARIAFDGNALRLKDEPRLVGTFRLQQFDGSPWIEAGRAPPVSGSIVVNARREAIGLDGTLTSPELGDEPLRVQGGAEYVDRRLEILSFDAWLPRSGLRLTSEGTAIFDGAAPTLALEGGWTALRWPLTGTASFESSQGTYRLAGAMPYTFSVRGLARGPQLPSVSLTAAGEVSRESLRLDAVDALVLRGRIQGAGTLNWTGAQPWRFDVQAREIDIRELRRELDGRVNAQGTIEGRGLSADAEWTASLRSLSGTLFGRSLAGSGAIAHRAGEYELRDVRITNDQSRLLIDGRWGSRVDLEWDADLQTLGLLAPEFSGRLISRGRASGSAREPRIDGTLTINDARHGDTYAELITADVELDLTDAEPSQLDVQARDVTAGGILFHRIGTTLEGRMAEHALTAEVIALGDDRRRIPGFTARLEATGTYERDANRWSGVLSATDFTYPDGSALLLQPAALEFSPAAVHVAPICLSADESRLCAEGDWTRQPNTWRALYSAQDWPLKRVLTSLLGWREFDGAVQASGWISQEPGQPWIGGTTILLDNPTLDIPRNKFRSERVRLGGGRVDVYVEQEQLRGSVDMKLGEQTRVEGSATAPRPPGVPLGELPLQGQFRGESAQLNALPLFVPEIDYSSGRLDASVTIGGKLSQPEFTGDFAVRDGRFELYRTNLVLSDATLDGRFERDELTFNGKGQIAKGPIRLTGRFTWPDGVMTGEMRLSGEQLLVADTPEYRVLASPDLTFRAGTDGIDVDGQIRVPSARISPKDLSSSVSTSPDERVVGLEDDDDSPSTAERLRSRIRIAIGNDVRVDSYGLKARLGGDLTVTTQPGDVARGDGEINVAEGEYKAFGQQLKITRGRLTYANTPLSAPVLDLVAEREIEAENITVAVNVRGSLDNPYIGITSTPAMSSNEALSYLLTGRSIDTLQSGEAQSVDQAAQSLAVGGGGLLLGGIGSKLGLDEVYVERTGTDDTSVVLGKYLSPKLFISYGISVTEAINTIKLRYTLNERWFLRAEAGLDQSADIEYRIER
jgi:translocation and assembly module TamB